MNYVKKQREFERRDKQEAARARREERRAKNGAPDSAEKQPKESFLQSRLERAVWGAILNAGASGISEAKLDYLFTKRVMLQERTNIFTRLGRVLNLVKCEVEPGGNRIWFAVKRRTKTQTEGGMKMANREDADKVLKNLNDRKQQVRDADQEFRDQRQKAGDPRATQKEEPKDG